MITPMYWTGKARRPTSPIAGLTENQRLGGQVEGLLLPQPIVGGGRGIEIDRGAFHNTPPLSCIAMPREEAVELPLLGRLSGEDLHIFRDAFHTDGDVLLRLHRDISDLHQIGRARSDIGM